MIMCLENFTKLLQHSHNVLFISWCSNVIKHFFKNGFKIAIYIYVVHIFSLVDGSWIKVDEDAFKRLVIEVKNSCVEVAQTLLKKLLRQFFEHEIMMSLALCTLSII